MEIMRSPEQQQQQPNSIQNNAHEHSSLDENLYSRQLYVLGADGMKKMLQSDVLVIGLDGLGVEISKNIALAGVRSLTLWDAQAVQIEDLCSNFYLSTNDLGKSRAAACRSKLDELNPYVPVKLLESGDELLSFETISSQFHVIIAANMPIQQQCLLDALCHQKGNVFIGAQVAGVFGHVFCDFGPEFTVLDSDGEPCASGIISSITTDDSQGIVTCLEETKHNLEDGHWVRFREVKGMIGLNYNHEDHCDNENSSHFLRQISVISPHSFAIGSTVGLGGDYSGGGIFEQVKRPQTLNFIPMKESLKNPSFVTSDFAKIEHQTLIVGLFEALGAFQEENRKFPQLPDDFHQFSTLLSASCSLNSTLSSLEECKDLLERDEIKKLVMQFIAGASCLVAPMASVIGGLAAQEALKACTAKFTPIRQHFVFDAVETLPSSSSSQSVANQASSHSVANQVSSSSSRYAPLLRLFGDELCQKLFNYRQFLVGSGAIGCEMLKNWALLGLGTGPNGSITVTDMDTIEKSNLNRQFLFRPSDLSLPKSEVAAAAVLAINPDLSGHIHPFVERVAAETEETFNCKFFQQIDCVTNALDNVAAREYMDKRCVLFEKPLLESGTLGTKGNVQVVIPHLTESYSSSQDPPEKSIPSCTIRNFPSQIEHTINWALDFFKGTFTAQPESVKAYLEDPKAFLETLTKGGESTASQRETLEQIHAILIGERPRSFEDCIRWARMKFEELFRNNIVQLLHSFPPDATTSTGMPFWSGSKRCPVALEFDPEDPLHFSFIESASHLRAFLYGISPASDDFKSSSSDAHKSSLIKSICSQMTLPPFQPSSRIRTPSTHEDQTDSSNSSSIESPSSSSSNHHHSDEDDAKAIQNLLSLLPHHQSQSSQNQNHSNDHAHALSQQIRACQFEKDDDSNWHIDFIAAAANLRATNYSIPAAERLKIKQIAGKIIPAIATTTSLIVGLVCLEMIKLIGLGVNNVDEQLHPPQQQRHSISTPTQASQQRSRFKNGFVNLALPFFAFSEPLAPPTIKWQQHEWTLWDSIKLKGPLTLQALIDHFSRTYSLSISIISWGPCMIWNCFGQMPKAKLEERLGMELGALCTLISKKPLPPREVCDFLQLNVLASGCCNAEEEEEIDVDVPVVLYQLCQ